MGILFVNGKRRGTRVRGSAVIPRGKYRRAAVIGEQVGPRARPKSRLQRGLPLTARYKRVGSARVFYGQPPAHAKSAPKRRRATALPKTARMRRRTAASVAKAAAAAYVKRGRPRRSTSMAKRKSSKRRRAMLKVWRARKAAGKMGGIGRTRRARKPRKVRRKRARRASAAPKRRRKRRVASGGARRRKSTKRSRAMKRIWRARRKAGKRGGIGRTRRVRARRRKRTGGRRKRARARRPRSIRVAGMSRAIVPWDRGMHKNPRRRRGHRRYSRRYRRNPGLGGLMGIIKGAIPVLASLYGTRAVVGLLGAHVPGIASLGALAQPLLSIGAIFGLQFAAGKVSFLGRHRNELMIGAGLAALDSLVRAFAPAAVKSMIPGLGGVGDYVQMGDYIAVGAAPLDDNMTLSDYIAVGGDGIQEELGLEEELGVDEELGDATLGGVMGSQGRLLAPVPSRSFLAPIPARSFTKTIPPAGTNYDNPGQLYNGIFGGGFGR